MCPLSSDNIYFYVSEQSASFSYVKGIYIYVADKRSTPPPPRLTTSLIKKKNYESDLWQVKNGSSI